MTHQQKIHDAAERESARTEALLRESRGTVHASTSHSGCTAGVTATDKAGRGVLVQLDLAGVYKLMEELQSCEAKLRLAHHDDSAPETLRSIPLEIEPPEPTVPYAPLT